MEKELTARQKWHAEHTIRINFTLRLNKENDKAIIKKLSNLSNKTDYIRQLIKKDIEGEN